MRRLAAIVLVGSIAFAAAAKPKKAPAPPAADAPPPPPAAVTRSADGLRVDLAAEGTLLGWAAPRAGGNRRVVYALIAPATPQGAERACTFEDPDAAPAAADAKLYRWSPEHPDHVEPLAGAYPHGTLEAADLDGDGREELLLIREGEIDELGAADGTVKPLLRDPALGLALPDPRAARSRGDAADPALRLTVDGRFVTYHREPEGAVQESASLELPVRISKGASRVYVVVPEAVLIAPPAAAPAVFATMPEQVGPQRLRTWLLQPEAPGVNRARECWLQLPAAERPLDTAFAVIDGAPSVIVTTMSAEKLDLFGEKRVRVFSLGSDRTRAGESPRFAATTGLNLWQVGYPVVADLNGDTRDDLIIGYWKGLKRSIAALEVYPGFGGGAFGKAKSMELSVDGADEAFMAVGDDFDGDARPDLLVIAAGEARVYPGNAPEVAAEKPFRGEPSRTVPLLPGLPKSGSIEVSLDMYGGISVSRRPPGLGTPRLIDLDGDGRPEMLFAGDLGGRARISVVAFRGQAAAEGTLADGASISYK